MFYAFMAVSIKTGETGNKHFNFSNSDRSSHTFSYNVYKMQDLKTF